MTLEGNPGFQTLGCQDLVKMVARSWKRGRYPFQRESLFREKTSLHLTLFRYVCKK